MTELIVENSTSGLARGRHEIINKDPYADVRLSRIYDTRGVGTDKFMVEMQSPEDEWIPIPGTRAVHSLGYNLITNAQVRDMAHEVIDATGLDFKPIPGFGEHSRSGGTVWNGKHYLERWYTGDVTVKTPSGSDVMLGLEVRNSYDKSCSVGLAFFAMHMACANQFYSHNLFGRPFSFRHVDSGDTLGDNFQDALDGITQKASEFGKVLPHIHNLMEKRFESTQDFLELRRRLMEEAKVEFRDKHILDELTGGGITRKVGLDVGDAYGSPDSYWALANAYTAISSHIVGGLRGHDLSQRAVDFLIDEASR